MRKLSSVFYMWIGLACGIIATLMMFVPFANYDGGTIVAASHLFWGMGQSGGAWLSFVGYMFILVGSIAMGVMALPVIQPSIKAEKIVLISCGIVILVGTILVGLTTVEYAALGGTLYDHLEYFMPGFYLSLFFAIAAITMDVIALVLDW